MSDDVVIQNHNRRHDEDYDLDCPICLIARDAAAKAWDTTGTDEYALRVYRESVS